MRTYQFEVWSWCYEELRWWLRARHAQPSLIKDHMVVLESLHLTMSLWCCLFVISYSCFEDWCACGLAGLFHVITNVTPHKIKIKLQTGKFSFYLTINLQTCTDRHPDGTRGLWRCKAATLLLHHSAAHKMLPGPLSYSGSLRLILVLNQIVISFES